MDNENNKNNTSNTEEEFEPIDANKVVKKLFLWIALLTIGVFVGAKVNEVNTNNANTSENIYTDEDYRNLNKRYENLDDSYSELIQKYNILFNKYNSCKENENDQNSNLSNIQNEIQNLETEKQNIQNEITKLNLQLTSIKNKIDNNKNEPISFYAGEYICGKDFPVGRYLVYDGDSNFKTYNKNDRLQVNIILSNEPDWGVAEYLHFFEEGEKIVARSKFKLKLID